MADKKGGSWLGALFNNVDEESPAKPVPVSQPMDFRQFVAPPLPSGMSGGMTPPPVVDDEALTLVRKKVYLDTISGRPSRLMQFMKMWEALGSPQDASVALRALQVTDASITAQAILDDLGAHTQILQQVQESAKGVFEGAMTRQVGAIDDQMKQLQQANETAQKEIARHQQETTERNTQMSTLQGKRIEEEAKVSRGKQREEMAESVVRAQLQSVQQLLASIH